MIDLTTLPNGVRLVMIPMPGVNSVATSVMVAVGSRYETPTNNGISHFLEHMVFKGTAKYPTTDAVNIVEKIGGMQNAYTDVDITNYHNKVLASDWELGLEMNKELALNPLLAQEHIDRERDVIIEEMKRYDDEPASKVGEVFHAMMYPGAALGMRVIGEEQSLRSLQGEALRGYHDTWYQPKQIVVTLAGAIQNTEIVRRTVETWFGSQKNTKIKAFEKVQKSHQDAPRVEVFVKKDAQQAHLILGIPTFARDSQDRFAWNLFNLIMGVSFTSRLFKKIREERGLCYHIRSSSDNWAETGYWSIYAGVATDKLEEAVKAIVHEIVLAREKGVSEEEVMIAKKRLKTALAFKSEDPEFFGEYYGRQLLYGLPTMTLEDYETRIEGITKEEIDSLIGKYCIQKNLNLAVVSPSTKGIDVSLLTSGI